MWGRIKTILAVVVSAYLIFATAVPPDALGAAAEAGYEVIADGISYGNDVIVTGLNQAVFHQQSITGIDLENAKVSFPGSLRFGNGGVPVNMALPMISQTSLESVSASSTGFFTADLPFYPCCNNGAAPVGFGHIGDPSPVSAAAFEGNGLLFPEMVVRGSLVRPANNSKSTRVTLPPITATGPYNEVAAIQNTAAGTSIPYLNTTNDKPQDIVKNKFTVLPEKDRTYANNTTASSNNRTAPIKPMVLSSSTYNFSANSSLINNTGIVERLWRNSHLSHLQDLAYEGDPSSPTWIAPAESPKNTTDWRDMSNVLKHGLNMTQPGKYLTRSFWEL